MTRRQVTRLAPNFAELLDRLPGLRLAVEPGQMGRRHRTMIRGPQTLPVTW
ncbi:hypothetical protein [Streptomyces sp. NPDC101165]|uniref:hypothetical protein n=1 Tax=Streptomyces sp. NPDC101165 TaxID=3366119 RepID=UPI0037F37764